MNIHTGAKCNIFELEKRKIHKIIWIGPVR